MAYVLGIGGLFCYLMNIQYSWDRFENAYELLNLLHQVDILNMFFEMPHKGSYPYINSLWPSDAIRRQGTESTLARVMACCLTAPSHYLHQCWLIISTFLWHSSEGIIMRRSEDTNQQNKIKNYIFRIAFRSPRGQWVKRYEFYTTFYTDTSQEICKIRMFFCVLLWFVTGASFTCID